jgi:hypothetical protein
LAPFDDRINKRNLSGFSNCFNSALLRLLFRYKPKAVLKIQFIIYKTCYVLCDEVLIQTTYHGFPLEVMVRAIKLQLIVVSYMMTQAYIINGGGHPSVEYEIG